MRRLAILLLALLAPATLGASEAEKPVARVYAASFAAPMSQTPEQAAAKSDGCASCHTKSDERSMHASPAVVLGCTDCHGGDARVVGRSVARLRRPGLYRRAQPRARAATLPQKLELAR